MEEKRKLVAISYDRENKCEKILEVVNMTEKDYKKCLNEQAINENKQIEKELRINKHIQNQNKEIEHLANRDFVLAKSIYDRGVDRGYIDENKEFDKAFYDYIFENKPIDSKLLPDEFKKILERVESL